MGFRFFKRIKIAPGVSLNLSKNGVSVSVGPKGAKVTVGSTGKVTGSVGIPGTGIYYRETVSGSKLRSGSDGSNIVIINGNTVKHRAPNATPFAMKFAKACGMFAVLCAIVMLCWNEPVGFGFAAILGILPFLLYRKFKCEKCGAVDYPGVTTDGEKFCNHCLGNGITIDRVTVHENPDASVVGTFADSRDGQTYKTITIGGKTWMAQNLNYKAEGSRCYYDNESYGNIYGRLYDWETAKIACPAGWRLPTRQEWDDLVKYAGSFGAKKLKSKSGWNCGGNGTDDYGFSALPGGYYQGGGFDTVGEGGYWWTATEDDALSAYFRYIGYGLDFASENSTNRGAGISVRCVRDRIGGDISMALPTQQEQALAGGTVADDECFECCGKSKQEQTLTGDTAAVGTFTDSRDGQTYKTVTIGGKTWMAQNLNYKAESSWRYDDNEGNSIRFGRLYNWETAKAACPAGWHLPSRQEWDDLVKYVGRCAGKKLKSKSGWNNGGNDNNHELVDAAHVIKIESIRQGSISLSLLQLRMNISVAKARRLMEQLERAGIVGPSKGSKGREVLIKTGAWGAYIDDLTRGGNGTDDCGFSALPDGCRYHGEMFMNVGTGGYWWTATEDTDASNACYRGMRGNYDGVLELAINKCSGFSVRCVQD